MKKIFTLFSMVFASLSLFAQSGTLNVPSLTISPNEEWKANVMLFLSTDYHDNIQSEDAAVLATPPDDANGKKWYETDYQLTSFDMSTEHYCYDNENNPLIVSNDGAWEELSCKDFVSNFTGTWQYGTPESHIPGDIYYRRTFTASGSLSGVLLSCGYDEGPAEWYLNGTLIKKVSSGYNKSEVMMLTSEQVKLIKTDGSTNVLAVHMHNRSGDSYADSGLYSVESYSPAPYSVNGFWDCEYISANANVMDWDEFETLDYETDSDWKTGKGPFENPEYVQTIEGSTTWESCGEKNLYVRRHFTLTQEQVNSIGVAMLAISYDQGPTVWVNEKCVFQKKQGDEYTKDISTYDMTKLNIDDSSKSDYVSFNVGDNLIAVKCTAGAYNQFLDIGLYFFPKSSATGINAIASDGQDTAKKTVYDNKWYDLTGRQLSEKPTKAGLYIFNGRKVVIK